MHKRRTVGERVKSLTTSPAMQQQRDRGLTGITATIVCQLFLADCTLFEMIVARKLDITDNTFLLHF